MLLYVSKTFFSFNSWIYAFLHLLHGWAKDIQKWIGSVRIISVYFFFYSNPVPHLVDYTMKSTQRASTLVSNSTSAFISVSDKWLRARNKQAYLSGHHVFPWSNITCIDWLAYLSESSSSVWVRERERDGERERERVTVDAALKTQQIFSAVTRGSLKFDALLSVQLLSKVMEAN